MVQKPKQNMITVVLFVTAILIVVMAGVMTDRVLEESGIVPPGMTLSRVVTDSANSPPESMPVHEIGSRKDCEVIYHQASLRSEYDIVASESGEDALPALYYAVYVCTCPSVTALVSA